MVAEAQYSRGSHLEIVEKDGQERPEFFGTAMKDVRGDTISQKKLSIQAGRDHSFVSRLESGGRFPSIDTVEAIIVARDLDKIQADRLKASAGFSGQGNTIHYDEDAMLSINAILRNPDMPEDTKEKIRAVLHALGNAATSDSITLNTINL